MEVIFTLAINKNQMDIVDIRKTDLGVDLECLCEHRLFIPIHHFQYDGDAVTDIAKLMFLKNKVQKIVESMFDSASTYYIEEQEKQEKQII